MSAISDPIKGLLRKSLGSRQASRGESMAT